jgi:hypothetical protein
LRADSLTFVAVAELLLLLLLGSLESGSRSARGLQNK